MVVSLLTTSRAATFRLCPREEQIAYRLGYRAAHDSGARLFGHVYHAGLESVWRSVGICVADPLDDAIAALRAAAAADLDRFELVRAEEMLTGYVANWYDRMLDFEVLSVEAAFRAGFLPTYDLGGKLDVLVRERATRRDLIVEHKTGNQDIGVGSDYWKKLRLDGQISTYFTGAWHLGYDPVGCIYDVSLKPRGKPGAVPLLDEAGVPVVHNAEGQRVRTKDGRRWRQTADKELGYVLQSRSETVDEFRARIRSDIEANPGGFYAWQEIPRFDSDLEEYRFDLQMTARMMDECEASGRFPRNGAACYRFGRWCDFYPHCAGGASLDDTTYFRKLDDVHPELAVTPEEPT